MRMARKKTTETSTESSKEIKARGKFTRASKCMKTTTKKVHESGKHTSKTEKKKSPSDSPPSFQVQSCVNTKHGAQQVVPILDLHSVQRPSGKMKLQLFPLDAHTRQGLEKDGFHPYLELTLSSRKKVSSVLQHIHSKWVSSQIARGDPTLYPYDQSRHPSGPKWTPNSCITMRDVYVAIGAPSLFRLRYGWSSETCDKTDEPPSPSTPGITCFPNIEPENIFSNKRESASFTGKQMFEYSSEHTPPDGQVESTAEKKINNGSGPTFFSWDDDGLTSLSIGGLLSEVSLKGNDSKNSNANPTLWVENLTNISIGGLFSEASLQGKRGIISEASSRGEGRFSDGNKTWETRGATSQHPLPLISDSLDAFLVNQTTGQPRAPRHAPPPPPPPPPELSHSSILDAEDTCHAFSFRKRTTTSPKVLEQVSEETEEQQQKDESKPAKGLFGSGVFNQDSSLGFSGIKWADSRGPFDFGLSLSSRKFTNGDSVSFGAAVKDLREVEPSEEKIKLQKH
ncbi:TSL-kinase interacting protein 1 [Raphanus sativus]|uniref:TSL-kinase interacting protein 1 isoform X1 n=1 Tax=Raphanus sativus TaxID=3726 RepID=A0A6J0KKR3_RAPSA|nr:TSL-kinase interacting protein 1 isoform X1 [Raphanus sativus]KAJ4880107.1 TSL-kinase interacting protein 1 [Raphanus sativus]